MPRCENAADPSLDETLDETIRAAMFEHLDARAGAAHGAGDGGVSHPVAGDSPAPEPADRHPELLGHAKLGVAGEDRVWSATRSAVLVRAVPSALVQQDARQLFPLAVTTKPFDREEGLGDEVAVALQPPTFVPGGNP